MYKVLITTSGTGSRLGEFTDFTNKSLVPVGDKFVISHIVERYPDEVPIVVTLGHFGHHVQQYLELAYPSKFFEFVSVKPYQGPKSSLAFSMLAARSSLECPFIFHASDSIILNDEIPAPTYNWVGGYRGSDSSQYSSFNTLFNQIVKFNSKGSLDFDFLHIGVVGINDFKVFWDCLELIVMKKHSVGSNDISGLEIMKDRGIPLQLKEFTNWIDVGNIDSLQLSQKSIPSSFSILRKKKESISFVNGRAIKFFSDPRISMDRLIRAQYLQPFIPEIKNYSENFYSYEFVDGNPMSQIHNEEVFESLLDETFESFWIADQEVSDEEFYIRCENFYITKTLQRISEFRESRKIDDKPILINGRIVPALDSYLDSAFDIVLQDLLQVRIHGDLVLDNIIRTSNNQFAFIDWREDFGGNLRTGDLYYDLSKLKHSLIVNHDLIMRNCFKVVHALDEINCDILVHSTFLDFQARLEKWITAKGLNSTKINVLTCLIWINMAPLHHHPFDKFLYFFGRYRLWRALND